MKRFAKRNALTWWYLVIAFILLTNVPASFAQQECNITNSAPAPTTGAIASTDTAQTGRPNRDGRGGTCLFLRTPPAAVAGSFLSDQYTFTNTTGGPICVYVDLDATGCGVATNQISMEAFSTYNPANPVANMIGDPGLSTGGAFANSMNFSVANGASYTIVVHNVNTGTFCASYTFRQTYATGCRQPGFDAANDGSADMAQFRPSGGLSTWHTLTTAGASASVQLGSTGDVPVPGDYTGDETSDVAVYRPGASGIWYTSTNAATNYGAKYWGTTGDVPVQGDYDRDGITDLAVFRPSDNNWYVLRSGTGTWMQILLGATGDKAVPADYDGDGKTDVAIFRPSTGRWIYLSSAGNYGSYSEVASHGTSTDIPVPADYDGDGKADIAVFRPSDGGWYILRTSLAALGVGQNLFVPFGTSGDIPQPADYDGDKKVDQAVFRPSTNTWWLNRSTAGTYAAQFGQTGDVPASAPNTIP